MPVHLGGMDRDFKCLDGDQDSKDKLQMGRTDIWGSGQKDGGHETSGYPRNVKPPCPPPPAPGGALPCMAPTPWKLMAVAG